MFPIRSLFSLGCSLFRPQGHSDPLAEQWDIVDSFLHTRINTETKEQCTPLSWAVQQGHLALCEKLLLKGAHDIQECFATALKLKQFKIADLLLVRGADLYADHGFGLTVLHLMASSGNIEAAAYLLDKGMHVDTWSLITFEECPKTAGLTEEAQRATALLFKKRNGLNITPLILAVQQGQEEMVEFLCRKGAHPQATDFRGLPPLFYAFNSPSPNINIIQTLKNYGADLNPTLSWKGISICLSEFLISSKNIRGLEIQIALGVDLTIKTMLGSLLGSAIVVNSAEAVMLLLKNNIEVKQCTDKLESPFLLALILDRHSEPYFDEIKKRDEGFTEALLKVRLVGHRFSLRGEFSESLNTPITLPALLESLHAFENGLDEEEERSICKEVRENLEEVAANLNNLDYFLKKVEENQPVIMPFAIPGHALAIGLSDNVIKCNRGYGSNEKPGIRIYSMVRGDVERKKEALKRLFEMKESLHTTGFEEESLESLMETKRKELIEYIYGELNDYLGLECIKWIGQTPQKRGVCGWMAAKECLIMGLLFAYQGRGLSLNEATRKLGDIYCPWSRFDRLHAVKELATIEQDPLINKIVDFREIYGQILYKCLTKPKKYLAIIDYLLKKDPSLALYKDPVTGANLLFAVVKQPTDQWWDLIKLGAERNVILNNGNSLLQACVEAGASVFAKELIEDNIFDVNVKNAEGQTPLHIAAKQENLMILYPLIEAGGDIHARDTKGYTPLFYAVINNNVETALTLIVKGADVRECFDGKNLFQIAQERENAGIEYLLVNGTAHFNAPYREGKIIPNIFFNQKGSQEGCNGSTQPEKVEKICRELNNNDLTPKEITFSTLNKPIDTIQGGVCTAMCLDFAHRILQQPSVLIAEVFQQDKRYQAASEKFRTLQAAFNCIEVVGELDYSPAEHLKIQAMATHFSMEATPAFPYQNLDKIDRPDLAKEILSLSPGLYIIRMVQRAENAKLEEHGHTTLLIKREDGDYHYMDPNKGYTSAMPKDGMAGLIIVRHLQGLNAEWQTPHMRFYRLDPI